MAVSGIGNGPSAIQTPPPAPPAPARAVPAGADRAVPRPLTGIADAADELPRRAWFDLDGDGRLEPWKPLYGGDGTIVWDMPGDDPGTKSRRARAVPENPLVLDAARAAYQRYG